MVERNADSVRVVAAVERRFRPVPEEADRERAAVEAEAKETSSVLEVDKHRQPSGEGLEAAWQAWNIEWVLATSE